MQAVSLGARMFCSRKRHFETRKERRKWGESEGGGGEREALNYTDISNTSNGKGIILATLSSLICYSYIYFQIYLIFSGNFYQRMLEKIPYLISTLSDIGLLSSTWYYTLFLYTIYISINLFSRGRSVAFSWIWEFFFPKKNFAKKWGYLVAITCTYIM